MVLVLSALACNVNISLGDDDGSSGEVAENPPTAAPDTATPLPDSPTAQPPTPEPDPPTPTPTQECEYNATIVADLSVAAGAEIPAGQSFDKTWRIANTGCQDWQAGTELIYLRGDQLGGPIAVEVGAVASGGTTDVTVPLAAPDEPGDYRTAWQLRAANGIQFGPVFTQTITVIEPADEDGDSDVFLPGLILPTPSFTDILIDPSIFNSEGDGDSGSGGSGSEDAAESIQRQVATSIWLHGIDYDPLSAHEERESTYIEDGERLVVTSVRPRNSVDYSMCVDDEVRLETIVNVTLVEGSGGTVHVEVLIKMYEGSACPTASFITTDKLNLVLAPGAEQTKTLWNSKGGAGYDIEVTATNNSYSGE